MKIFFAFLIFLSACSDNNFAVYSHLDSLRVLALIADQPEVAPGATVTITPYISDATGKGRALTFSASACPDLSSPAGLTPTCAGNPQAVALGSGAVSLPSSAHSYTGAVQTLSVTIPPTLLVGRTPIDIYNGVAYIVTYSLTAADGTSTQSYRRILVSQGHAYNQNPSITDILNAGASFAAMPTDAVSLLPSFAANSSESYTYEDSSGNVVTANETLLVSWFTNAGDYLYIRTDAASANTFTPGKTSPVTGVNTFVWVVRDARGGDQVLQKDF